jgi:hypothetical protein
VGSVISWAASSTPYSLFSIPPTRKQNRDAHHSIHEQSIFFDACHYPKRMGTLCRTDSIKRNASQKKAAKNAALIVPVENGQPDHRHT